MEATFTIAPRPCAIMGFAAARAEERSGEADAKNALPLIRGKVGRRDSRTHAGVVDENVEASESRMRFFDNTVDLALVGDVEPRREG